MGSEGPSCLRCIQEFEDIWERERRSVDFVASVREMVTVRRKSGGTIIVFVNSPRWSVTYVDRSVCRFVPGG